MRRENLMLEGQFLSELTNSLVHIHTTMVGEVSSVILMLKT